MEETIPEDVLAAAMKAQNDAMERCKNAGLAAYEYPYASGRAREVLDEEIANALLAERERCAKVAEAIYDQWNGSPWEPGEEYSPPTARDAATSIRSGV